MAVIYSQQGKPLRIDTNDALWLARAVEAEGEPRPEVAQTLVNRWAWLAETPKTAAVYPTLADLVRAYCQPVNPAWFVKGRLFVPYLDKHGPTEGQGWVTHELQKAWRREHVHSVRNEFSDRTRRAVQQAFYGPLTIGRGALHFGPVEGVQGNVVRIDPQNLVLYQPEAQGGPRHSLASLFEGRPHAVIGGMLLAGGSIFLFARAHRRKRR